MEKIAERIGAALRALDKAAARGSMTNAERALAEMAARRTASQHLETHDRSGLEKTG